MNNSPMNPTAPEGSKTNARPPTVKDTPNQEARTSPDPMGFGDPAEPAWAPPENQPEPRPIEPILKSNSQPSPTKPDTNPPT